MCAIFFVCSCRFLHLNHLFQLAFSLFQSFTYEEHLITIFKSLLFQKLFWPFTVYINCSSHNLNKVFSQLLHEQFYLTWRQNNFRNKIPIYISCSCLILSMSKDKFLIKFVYFEQGNTPNQMFLNASSFKTNYNYTYTSRFTLMPEI